jgi:hypothetical protein
MIEWLRRRLRGIALVRAAYLSLVAPKGLERRAARRDLVLLLVFYGIVTPIGIVRRLLGGSLRENAGWTKIQQSTADRALFECES